MAELLNNIQKERITLWPAMLFCLIQFCTVTDNVALMNASSAIAATFKPMFLSCRQLILCIR